MYLIILRKVADHREGQRGDTQGVTDIALIAVVVNLSILDPLCALGGDNHWNRFQHVHHRPPDESLDGLQWLASTIQCFHYTGFHYTVFPLNRVPLYSVVDDRFNREFVPRVAREEPEDGMTSPAHLKKEKSKFK